mmetsp:Transcript_12322/g.37092  ORF Transcript_12322/g.37092 Transcript_12322/m.37092 type:complete len:402 (+) Transcript_12322:1561-2766(+)
MEQLANEVGLILRPLQLPQLPQHQLHGVCSEHFLQQIAHVGLQRRLQLALQSRTLWRSHLIVGMLQQHVLASVQVFGLLQLHHHLCHGGHPIMRLGQAVQETPRCVQQRCCCFHVVPTEVVQHDLEPGQDGAKGHDAELGELSKSTHIAQPRIALAPNSVPPPLQALELRLQVPHHPLADLGEDATECGGDTHVVWQQLEPSAWHLAQGLSHAFASALAVHQAEAEHQIVAHLAGHAGGERLQQGPHLRCPCRPRCPAVRHRIACSYVSSIGLSAGNAICLAVAVIPPAVAIMDFMLGGCVICIGRLGSSWVQRQRWQQGVQVREVLVEGTRVLVLEQTPRQVVLVLGYDHGDIPGGGAGEGGLREGWQRAVEGLRQGGGGAVHSLHRPPLSLESLCQVLG